LDKNRIKMREVIRIIFCFLFFTILINCQKNRKGNNVNNETKVSQNLDFINYPIDDLEGITSTQYDGIYRNFDYKYSNGEATFILVPKVGAENWYTQQINKYTNQDVDAAIERSLNEQSFKKISNDFDIWVFHIPKEFLKYTPNMDAPYTQLIPRKVFLYKYDSSNNSYVTIDIFNVHNESDVLKEDKWRENYINKLASQRKNKLSNLDQWVGTFINSDDESLKSYDEIKNRIGWYELVISLNEITYHNDNRMESEFPTEAPGGYVIDYKCDYQISGDTLKLYKKQQNNTGTSKSLNKTAQPVVLLFKQNNKYYGFSTDIKDSEKLINLREFRMKHLIYFINLIG